MSYAARKRLVEFVKDRVRITADMTDDDINVAVRAIQDEFKTAVIQRCRLVPRVLPGLFKINS